MKSLAWSPRGGPWWNYWRSSFRKTLSVGFLSPLPSFYRWLLFSIFSKVLMILEMKKNVSTRFLSKASLGSSMLVAALLLGGMVWLTWRLIGSSHDPELPWDSNVLFYSTDPFSVSPNRLHVQASKCVVDSGQICPLCSITSYCFSFYLGEEMAT